MTDDRLQELVKRLYEQTDKGKVVWEKTPDKKTFQASFPTHAIRISVKDFFGDAVYEVSIYDKEGDMVERIETNSVWESTTSLPAEMSPIVADLYSRARRMALDVDQTLDTLLQTLASR